MNIKTYLQTQGLTQKAFADQLAVSPGLVWQWINGQTPVTAERAREIESATGGLVTRHELRPDIFDPPAEARPDEVRA